MKVVDGKLMAVFCAWKVKRARRDDGDLDLDHQIESTSEHWTSTSQYSFLRKCFFGAVTTMRSKQGCFTSVVAI